MEFRFVGCELWNGMWDVMVFKEYGCLFVSFFDELLLFDDRLFEVWSCMWFDVKGVESKV